MNKLKIFDMFCGIGGFRLGFEQVSNIFETVYAVDINKDCKKTYDLNFDKTKLTLDDIAKIDIKKIPNFDVLCAGFPCQSFSKAGTKKGLADDRGKLVYDMLEIIRIKKPKILLLENVKNFKTIHDGEPYKLVTETLNKYGYFVKDLIMNTCDYTHIPQNRERIFIVGFLNEDYYNNFEFPEKINDKYDFHEYLEKNIDQKYYYTDKSAIWEKLKIAVTDKNTVYQYRRTYVRENKNNNIPALVASMGIGGHNVGIIRDNKGIRKLTPRECFNFQGFPKTYEFPKVGDSCLYKQIGNSVTVELIKKIANNIHCAIIITQINNQLEELMLKKKGKKEFYGKMHSCEFIDLNKSNSKDLIKYYDDFKKLCESTKKISGRMPNLSEAFTEGIYCYLTNSIRVIKISSTKDDKLSNSFDCYNFDKEKSIQIKSSTMKCDCSSFGPNTQFDILIFMDFSKLPEFKVYEIDKKYLDDVVVCSKKNETVKTQKEQNRRPRFSIKKKIIDENKIKPLFTGTIETIGKYYKKIE